MCRTIFITFLIVYAYNMRCILFWFIIVSDWVAGKVGITQPAFIEIIL